MSEKDRLLKKLKCPKCKTYMESKYSNEKLQKLFPVKEGDTSFKNLKNIAKWRKLKRELKCPKCGYKKKISSKLLMKISKLRHDEEKKK